MEYLEIPPADAPLSLLLEADPSQARIRAYLEDSWCFAARADGEVVGACIARMIAADTAEIFNIAVARDRQQQGIGSALLRHALDALRKRQVRRVELGTGSFGYQLNYYQRIGFRVDAIWKDHFTDHYPEPVMEDGIRHRDMLRLSIDL